MRFCFISAHPLSDFWPSFSSLSCTSDPSESSSDDRTDDDEDEEEDGGRVEISPLAEEDAAESGTATGFTLKQMRQKESNNDSSISAAGSHTPPAQTTSLCCTGQAL